jgi:hypothetical protein
MVMGLMSNNLGPDKRRPHVNDGALLHCLFQLELSSRNVPDRGPELKVGNRKAFQLLEVSSI